MKRRNKNVKMPTDPVRFRKLVRKTLRLFQVKAHELEVQVALHRIAHGHKPSLYRACGDALERCKPERWRAVFKSVYGRMRGERIRSRGGKR